MALNVQIAGTPAYSDFPFMNFTGTDIPAKVSVRVDPANTVGASQQGIGIVLPTAAGQTIVGVTLDVIRAGTSGRVRCVAPLAVMIAETTITAGTYVAASGTAGHFGEARPTATGNQTIGQALTNATAGDEVLVLLTHQVSPLGPATKEKRNPHYYDRTQ